ncbi:MAG: hypothetical protein APR54_04150 [Candidatus Cloacimonas sp. SDB]|nr:MAG: hypothetical protein APR54_04150 [Candidatus Cloacimonas sp. SDB]
MSKNNTALFTTVYPEGTIYLRDWYLSVVSQNTENFDIWVGCDRISPDFAQDAMGSHLNATWIIRRDDESPAQFRERTVRQMIDEYSYIIFVDSDDILNPTRVLSAQKALAHHDVYGCAMQIIDESGMNTPIIFSAPVSVSFQELLLTNNIFGLSNTAYCSDILKKCLPFPKDVILLDWFIATRAMINDADLYFDKEINMKYRQHSLNTARVVPPFTKEQIIKATELVIQHYELLLTNIPEIGSIIKRNIIRERENVKLFYDCIRQSEEIFSEYIQKLNEMPSEHIWWSCVAHKELEQLWKK